MYFISYVKGVNSTLCLGPLFLLCCLQFSGFQYIYRVVQPSLGPSLRTFHHPKNQPCTNKQLLLTAPALQFQTTTKLLSISIDLPDGNASYQPKWNRSAVCKLLCLTYFTWRNIYKMQLCYRSILCYLSILHSFFLAE